MITITLEVDQVTDVAYQNLSDECKRKLKEDISVVVRNTINDIRTVRIKKILDEIAKNPNDLDLNAEILTTLLRDED